MYTATSSTSSEVQSFVIFKPQILSNQYHGDSGHISNRSIMDDASFTPDSSHTYRADVRTTVFDVAAYILESIGRCTTMKLHKLLYYCQAWSLVWDDAPLFSEKIEAWANGPVIRTLYNCHRGVFELTPQTFTYGSSSVLTDTQMETINNVLAFYADKSVQWLVNLTHMESPWLNARKGLEPTERGNVEIELSAMAEYYSSL